MKSKTGLVFLYYFAFASFLFGIKLWLIGKFGNETPLWDQWDAEAAGLYKPFVDGTLRFADLLTPHNEHHILTTSLLALLELIVNGIWNPLLQMVVNAALHITVMVLLVALITRAIGRNYLAALLAFSAFLFGLPFGWDNALSGFQSQFYFVLLFSIISLWLTTTHGSFSLWWNFGLFSSVLAFFSLASGIFCIGATALLGFIFYIFKLRKTNQQLAAIILLVGLFIAGVALTPVIAEHQSLKAGSVPQFFQTLFKILCWPSHSTFLGILHNAPELVFCTLMFWQRPAVNNPKWFLISLIIWTFGVASSIAYGRGSNPFVSRYIDLYAISILINFSCLLSIFEDFNKKWKLWSFLGLFIWIVSVVVCLQVYNANYSQKELRFYSDPRTDQEINTKNYVATGNINNLKNKTFLHIPYPTGGAEHLASILDMPEVRSILPANIAPPNRPVKEGRFDKSVNFLIANYYVFIGLGLLSAVICGLLGFFTAAKKSEKIPA